MENKEDIKELADAIFEIMDEKNPTIDVALSALSYLLLYVADQEKIGLTATGKHMTLDVTHTEPETAAGVVH